MAEDRITVSEDKLYRALGDLELRLVKSINDALDKKAEQAQVDALRRRLQVLEDSRLSRAHIEADVEKMKPRLELLERESMDEKAVKRAIRFAVGSVVITAIAVSADLAVLFGLFHS